MWISQQNKHAVYRKKMAARVTAQPSAFRRPFCRRVPLSMTQQRVCCLPGLSKNVGTYEPSFGSLCTVTFLAKRERVPANTSPPQDRGMPGWEQRRRAEQHVRKAERQRIFPPVSCG